MASEEEQARLKAAQLDATLEAKAAQKAAQAGAGVGAIWHRINFPNFGAAVDYANGAPAQQAGEFGVTADGAGGFDGYYFF